MKEKFLKFFGVIRGFCLANRKIVLRGVAVLVVLVAIFVIGSCFKGTEYGTSAGNCYNQGLAVENGKNIFYISVDDNEVVGINKVKNNGKGVQKVADGNVRYLNVAGSYIYCLEYDEENSSKCNLVKTKTNGKSKEILARDIDEAQVMVADKFVYYFKDGNFYRAKLDGTEKTKISDKKISYYQIKDNWIYYIFKKDNAQYIAKMKTNGEKNERISKADDDKNYEALYVKGNKIYYITSKANDSYDYEYYLFKMNKKGEKIKQICKMDSNIMDINMQDDVIYYTETEDFNNYKIKSIKYNGTDRKVIKKLTTSTSINITDDWIIFIGTNEDTDIVVKMINKKGEKERNI